eukprot:TRINITY_DN81857_c0_g1_i1.p1 TRINITY_DN81857_c0_g1~~TRINITY_DN81857_c0_g1_i1.p1  ORF type:complete len:264 (+),score=40.62 TRINITY_DN81857_c0_g1_i1:104-793(+)
MSQDVEEIGNRGESETDALLSPTLRPDSWRFLMAGPLPWLMSLHMAMHFVSMLFMPFVPYMGGAVLTHLLVLSRFGGELLGRLSSHSGGAPRLHLLNFVLLLRSSLLLLLVLNAWGVFDLGEGLLLMSMVSIFFGSFAWANSELMAIIPTLGSKRLEPRIAQAVMLLSFFAQLFGLCLGQLLTDRLPARSAPFIRHYRQFSHGNLLRVLPSFAGQPPVEQLAAIGLFMR